MDLYGEFYHSDKKGSYGDYASGDGAYSRDDYGYEDSYEDGYEDDDYGYDDDEIGYLNRGLWEYEVEFDRAAREIEKNHRSPAAKILVGLIIIAAALAIYLGVSGYVEGDGSEEANVRVSFVKAEEPGEHLSYSNAEDAGEKLPSSNTEDARENLSGSNTEDAGEKLSVSNAKEPGELLPCSGAEKAEPGELFTGRLGARGAAWQIL